MIEEIKKVLSEIKHPETGDNIVVLGIVQNIKADDSSISITLVFNPNDAFVSSIRKAVNDRLTNAFGNTELKILELKREVKPKKKEISDIGLSNVKKIIAVASGKGGVGKSTISVNLAVTLAKKGFKVGLIDADLYGPSIPTMMGIAEDEKPIMVEKDGCDLIEPIEKYGVKLLSIGFFISPEDAVIWRGPAATGALRQLTKQGNWGDLDFLIIDLPPGTGDIHITMAQELNVSSAVIVTTPQTVALSDVVRGVNMFRNKDVNIPIAGLIENMSWFTPAELPNNKYYIFGKDGGKKMAEKLEINLLGEIPLVQDIRSSGDDGTPIVLKESITAEVFSKIADNLLLQI